MKVIDRRRVAEFLTPIPKPKKTRKPKQKDLDFTDEEGISDDKQKYAHSQLINELRTVVDDWRTWPEAEWKVTPTTARLLKHWRHHNFKNLRPFFCQVEAAETAIFLAEVAPKLGKRGERYLKHLDESNEGANPGLNRLALKLATGAGKTTVMSMLIAWQTVNAVRSPNSKRFTKGFLIIAPGITIRDRLRVLLPNDVDSYYADREIVPTDMLPDIGRARIVITNYHSFKLREKWEISKGGKALIKGRTGDEPKTLESEGQMLQRVIPELMGMKNILVLNDEAHHCYREKPPNEDEEAPKVENKSEAKENTEAARLWISGIEAVQRKLGVSRVLDLSATPFFLSGSGYAEGTLFPWTMSDFSLMDAIECGIVKLPRVPVADNIPGEEMPTFRNLWENIRSKMPKSGRGKAKGLDPLKIPTTLQTALEALYGHYEKTYDIWRDRGQTVPPCFIVVCNNTATSKLVYDYISGFERTEDDGPEQLVQGRLPLFRNYDEDGQRLPRPRTLLIDSHQLESGEALDKKFRAMAGAEIEQFRSEIRQREGAGSKLADNIDDATLLREVMNTVGKEGRLGEQIRCVVSVSMLTEGWDTNTVTHVLGVRGFTTQLLCEQVIGRALRRKSYELNADNKFDVEYADVLGIPFDFNAKPVVAPPQPPKRTFHVKAIRPDRDQHEIRFPRVEGYRVDLPRENVTAEFTDDSTLELNPRLIGPSKTRNEGIIGEGVNLDLEHLDRVRQNKLVYNLTKELVFTKFRDAGDEPELHLFGPLKRITRQWLDNHLDCRGSTYPGLLMYKDLADMACEKIAAAITRSLAGEKPIKAVLDPFNPTGSTKYVNFTTSKEDRYDTATGNKCHVNWVILDSDWEAEFCRVAEDHPKVLRYVKNHGLGLEIPYLMAGEARIYRPDFIVHIDDGQPDPLNLVVEIKGFRGEDAKYKKETAEEYWVPAVNNLGTYGRWAFAEFCDVWEMESEFEQKVKSYFDSMIDAVVCKREATA